jgi:hypothetical protein
VAVALQLVRIDSSGGGGGFAAEPVERCIFNDFWVDMPAGGEGGTPGNKPWA